MVNVLPVRATTRSLPPRACPARVEAVPTATVPVVRVLRQVPVDPVRVALALRVPRVAQVDPVPQQARVDRVRAHRVPLVPVETVLLRA